MRFLVHGSQPAEIIQNGVDASDVSAGLLGHSYFAEDRCIMEDIFALLQTGQRADNRFGLEAVNTGAGRYWTFRK